MVVFKKIKNITTIGIADISGTGLSAIFWLYLATLMEPEAYGEISYYIGIATMGAAFATIGTANTITVFTSKNIKIESTLYFLSLVFAAIVSLILIFWFFRTDIVLLIFAYVINIMAIGELLGKKAFTNYSVHFLIQKGLTLILGLTFYFIFGAEGIIFALGISYVSYIIIVLKQFKSSKINFKLLKERSGFILNNYLYYVVAKSNSHLNRLIIVAILGFSVLGNFSLAMQMIMVVMTLPLIIFKYTLPHDAQGTKNIYLKKLTIIFSIIISLLGSLLFPFLILHIFPKYIEVIEPIQIMSFGIIPMTITTIYTSELLGNEKSRQLVISKIVSLIVFVSLIVILGSTYGIIGLAIGFLVSMIVETLCLIRK